MSRTVKGIYRNGHIHLLEAPKDVDQAEVVVTFPDGTESLRDAVRASSSARLAAWIAEDAHAGLGDWELLKAELDKDRLSSRKLFLK